MITIYPPANTLYSYDPDTLAYLSNYLDNYTRPRRIALDSLIAGLKLDGLWAKIYQLAIYANVSTYGYPGNYPDTYLARQNLKPGGNYTPPVFFNPTPPGYPAPFTPWRGFDFGQGPGVRVIKAQAQPQFDATIINSNWVPSNPGIRDDMSFGIWSLTDSQSTGGDIGMYQWDGTYDSGSGTYSNTYNTGWLLELRDGANQLTYRVHSGTSAVIPNANSKGLFIANRLDPTEMSVYRNGALLNTSTTPSTPAPASPGAPYDIIGSGFFDNYNGIPIGATRRPLQATLPTTFPYPEEESVLHPSEREYCLHFIGKGLTALEQLNLYQRLRDYLLNEISAADLGV